MRATRILISSLVALLLLSGCMPLKQFNVTGGEGYAGFGYSEGGFGELRIGPSNLPKTVSIVDAESFAIGPRGKRYGVESEPHRDPLIRKEKFPRVPYVLDRIYLVNAKGKRLSNWRNGDWRFTFILDTPEGRDSRHFDMTLWTFFYNPVVHGPPN